MEHYPGQWQGDTSIVPGQSLHISSFNSHNNHMG